MCEPLALRPSELQYCCGEMHRLLTQYMPLPCSLKGLNLGSLVATKLPKIWHIFLSHSWVFLAVWDRAPYCWYTILASESKLKMIHNQIRSSKILMYTSALILTPESIKMGGIFRPLEATPNIITKAGCFVLNLNLMGFGRSSA